MKKSLIAFALIGTLEASAFAQSSITLYGIVDTGLSYVNNDSGNQLWAMQGNILRGSRWGLLGAEDLGGGTKAIFRLENGFNPINGKLGQGGREFGRTAYVGLTNESLGTLTLGRQYDSFIVAVQPTTFNGQWGALFAHPSDIDNTDNSFRTNNVVKYASPSFAGVSAELMYAFGGVAGQFGSESTVATGLRYTRGPFYLGAGYFYAKNPAEQFGDGNFVASHPATPGVTTNGAWGYVGHPSNMQTFGLGGTYTIGPGMIGLAYTHVKFNDANGIDGNSVAFTNAEIWGSYTFTPVVTLGLGYTYTCGKVDVAGTMNRAGFVGDRRVWRYAARADSARFRL
ncbi:porin [Burkholderia sp. IMCC1007]|uniref:porin n=1 Tax=Burkholderia sp. IMCC1007 TaxID=3004104 RepID=UPI0022B30698|nr:porin [Burkholderia sp. IMCC1007]